MNPDTHFITFTEIDSKWIIDLDCKKHKSMKLLEDNIAENLVDDLGYGDAFLI